MNSALDKIYGQAIVDFVGLRYPPIDVEFDLNDDGMVDVNSWMSAEMAEIRDNAQITGMGFDFHVFFVDNPSDGSLGFMDFNQPYGYVHADVAGAQAANTVAHELGHGQGLAHTPDDAENLMHPTAVGPWRLRKAQWDDLNPSAP